jgi:DNA replication protein DnaC
VATLARRLDERGVRVDILVDNAGAGSSAMDTLETPDAAWTTDLELNLLAAVRLDRELVPGMIQRGHGVVVHISSIAGEWVRKGQPLCLIGDSGTGKSHLLIGLGTAAAEKEFRVKYTLATRLVNELVEAADEKNLARTIARYGRVDLLMIDELGYMELDRRGAELLFQVLTEREEKASVAIATNESFSGWTKTFTDPCLCAAIVDRLTFGGNIIETGTDSYRLAHTRQQHVTA